MSIFDLLFLALALLTAVTLLAALYQLLRGRLARSWRILRNLLIGAAIYFAIVAGTSLVLPRRYFNFKEPDCFDDWCISVDAIAPLRPQGANASYLVTLSLISRAKRISQRERNVVVYLTDASGKRYDPAPSSADVPISSLLAPGDSIQATRRFNLPTGVRPVGVVIDHEGGFPIGWFIIGYETWFRKPAVLPLS